LPRISIVTPSYNQGAWIERTIRSVLDQGYPDVEHIVVDALSDDATAGVLARYPHLVTIREADRGQADAVNKGMARASGAILAFLNADDTLEPGALHRVAEVLAPGSGRHVVMGRCRFIDGDDRFTGIEHPSAFESHERVLAIWKGYAIPQPAVFWTRAAWQRCGPLDADEHLVLDYELFCRMSRADTFHTVDRVLANYRLHDDSKTQRSDRRQRLDASIRVSQRHWGPWWTPMHLRLAASLAWHRLDRIGRGRELMRQAVTLRQEGNTGAAVLAGIAGVLLAPRVAFYVTAYPALRREAKGLVRQLLDRLAVRRPVTPLDEAHGRNDGVWPDGWVGPHAVLRLVRIAGGPVRLRGYADLTYMDGPLTLRLSRGVDASAGDTKAGEPVVVHRIAADGPFVLELPVFPENDRPENDDKLVVTVEADRSFVPDQFRHNGDHRPLAWRLDGVDGAEVDGVEVDGVEAGGGTAVP
jgi:glycosyltransferase involved in cell wall biosynthesis